VSIERPERYGKQLASHLGNKIPCVTTDKGWELTFDVGIATITPRPDGLEMTASAETSEGVARIQFVLDKHLKQFTTKLPDFEIAWH